MVLHEIPVPLAVIMVAVELAVRVGLLEQDVPGELLIRQKSPDCRSCPVPAFPGRNAPFIQLGSDFMRPFPGESLCKHPAHNFSLLLIDHHLSVHVIVAVGRIGDLEGAILGAWQGKSTW